MYNKQAYNDTLARQLLVDAYRIFFDANDYEPSVLIGYCRLVKDILDNNVQDAVCDIVLAQLIKVCNNFSHNSRFALIAKYGLNGKPPMSFTDIGEELYITASSASKLCSHALKKLRAKELFRQYSISARKQYMLQPEILITTNHICVLKLSTRVHNALSNYGITTIQQFLKLSISTIKGIPSLGATSINEILEKQKEIKSQQFLGGLYE